MVRTRVLSSTPRGAVLRQQGPGWVRLSLWIFTSGAVVVLAVLASWAAVLQITLSSPLVVTPVVLGHANAASGEATVVGESQVDGRSSRPRAPSPRGTARNAAPTAGTTAPPTRPPVIGQGTSVRTAPPSSATFAPPTLLPVRVRPVRVRPLQPWADEDDAEHEDEHGDEKGERARGRAESDDDD